MGNRLTRMIDKKLEGVDAYTIVLWVSNMSFNVLCRNFGHNFEPIQGDRVKCRWCQRVYLAVPGEFE